MELNETPDYSPCFSATFLTLARKTKEYIISRRYEAEIYVGTELDPNEILSCVFSFLAASSGSVTVNADSSVQILAEEAVSLDKLDAAVSLNNHSQYHWVIVLPLSLCVCVCAGSQARTG